MEKLERLPPAIWMEDLENWEKVLCNLLLQAKENNLLEIKGHLRIDKCKNIPQYYYIEKKGDTNGKYIPKSKLDFVKKLAQADYERKVPAAIKKEMVIINSFIKHYKECNASNLYKKLSDYRKCLVQAITLPDEKYIETWKNTKIVNKNFFAEGNIYETLQLEKVRSKSEVIIANTLYKLNVPYVYETQLRLGAKAIYPDFTCLNVRTRKEYIWEHFGLMDNVDYVAKNVNKLTNYETHGYIPGKNLIITMENSENVMTPQRAEKIIKEFLL